MKQEFIDYLNALMEAAPHIEKTPAVEAYIKTLVENQTDESPALTENGKLILAYMQEHIETHIFKARDIAEGLFINSRGVSGSLRKLVSDGFVEKMGENPVIYSITEKGKNFVID